jgi:cystathionine gamma-synthase
MEPVERAAAALAAADAAGDSLADSLVQTLPLAAGEAQGRTEMAGIAMELRADVARRLRKSILRMERFLRREECQTDSALEPTRRLGFTLLTEARHWLRDALHEGDAPPSEATLRSAYRLVAALEGLAAWSAPATQESHALGSYPLAATRDAVAYARYGGAEIAAQEAVYRAMLGFDLEHARVLLTSSGMTAYALIEAYLLRDVLQAEDRILLHPSVYFETRRQVTSLAQFVTCTVAGGSRGEMLAAIAAFQPKVVFVDPLSNAADFRSIDMLRLLDEAEQVCAAPTWFVVDSTLLSGGFDPFAGPPRRRVRVLYYESGCKYLQFGMDLGPAGLVVVAAALAERFEQLRRGIGAIGSESLVLPRASRATYLAFLRLQTRCAQRVVQAVAAASPGAGLGAIRAVFPAAVWHPDHRETLHYAHLGGVVVFRFDEAQLNRRQPLQEFIDLVVARARDAQLALTAGVSFGFCVPRIGAAWSSYDADEAFLRLSAGIDPELAAALGRLIVACAQEFAPPGLH